MHLQAAMENKIWFSKSETFNDPFDSSGETLLRISNTHDLLSALGRYDFQHKNYYNNLRQQEPNEVVRFESKIYDSNGKLISENKGKPFEFVSKILNNVYIFCACKSATNNLMWSHYGDHHKGFCIRYKKKYLEKLKPDHHQEVKYQKNRPSIADLICKSKDITPKILEQCYIKGEEWKYEEEYRFTYSSKNNLEQPISPSIYIEHDPEAVDMIIFGLRTSESDKAMLKKLMSGRNILFKDIKINENGFSLSVKP